MYQSPRFSTVVFTAAELQYWVPGARPQVPFTPTLVHITSEYERHTILLSTPEGHPDVAPRKPDHAVAMSKALRKCLADLRGDHNAVARVWCNDSIGSPASAGAAATGLFVLPGSEFATTQATFSALVPVLESREQQSGAAFVNAHAHVAA